MRKAKELVISQEQKAFMISEIKSYFLNERNEELGDLAANLILSFVMDKLAPEFYNQGIFDAYQFFQEKTEDLLGIQK